MIALYEIFSTLIFVNETELEFFRFNELEPNRTRKFLFKPRLNQTIQTVRRTQTKIGNNL